MGGGGCEVGETERLDRVRSPRVMGEARDKKKLTKYGTSQTVFIRRTGTLLKLSECLSSTCSSRPNLISILSLSNQFSAVREIFYKVQVNAIQTLLYCIKVFLESLQAQRDYFGAHTYELLSNPGKFVHTNWTGHGGNVSSSTYNA